MKLKLQYFGHLMNWLIWKDPDTGKDWRWVEKWMTEDEMVGWHHWLDGHEFEQTPGEGEGQGSSACRSPWGRRVRHDWATENDDDEDKSSSIKQPSLSFPFTAIFQGHLSHPGCEGDPGEINQTSPLPVLILILVQFFLFLHVLAKQNIVPSYWPISHLGCEGKTAEVFQTY